MTFSYLYLTAARKQWHHEIPDGWKRIAFDRGDYIECAIYSKPTKLLTDEDKEWLQDYGEKPKTEWLPLEYKMSLPQYADLADQWQPVETAPKNGTYIIVWQPNTLEPSQTIVCWDMYDEWWHCCDGKNPEIRLRGVNPTHWMPLPSAPE